MQCSVAQSNLVLNPSFEDHDSCWPGISGISAGQAQFWSSPNDGTSDFFSEYSYLGHDQCGYDSGFTTVPMSAFGFAYPHYGECYAGFGVVSNDPDQFREYIQGNFKNPLLPGRTYPIECFVSLAPFPSCFTDLGFYFSDTQISIANLATIIPLVPQFENSTANLIQEHNGWQRITGYYTAHGGENFVSIGCFKHTDSCHLVRCVITPSDSGQAAYMFVDDVAIYDTAKVDTIQLCMNDSILLGGVWEHSNGMYIDTISGLPVRFYINLRPESASLTIIDMPFALGDSVKAGYAWIIRDSIVEVPKYNIYGCDSLVRYVCRTNVGIGNELKHQFRWSIYPNPANDFILIKLSSNDPTKYSVTLIDMAGREVLTHCLVNDKIDISFLKSGLYFIQLVNTKTGNIVGTEKFVKE